MTAQQDAPPAGSLVFAFAGQASQYPGMGAHWARHDADFAQRWQRIRALLWSQLPADQQAGLAPTDVRRTHREIFAVQYALARTLRGRGLLPAATVGVSMGEICSAAIAGALSEAAAVELVADQARLIHELCPDGGMLVVPGQPDCLAGLAPEPLCELAMLSRRHLIVAGDRDGLRRIQLGLRQRRTAGYLLPVERGFHSPAIDLAHSAAATWGRQLSVPALPMVSSASTELSTARPAPDQLWSAIRQPIRFVEAARKLSRSGPYVWIDLGPGASISTMLAHNDIPTVAVHTLLASRSREGAPADLFSAAG